MLTAYKFMKMNEGLLAVFEKEISFGSRLTLDVVRIESDTYLKIGRDHLLRLEDETIECLKGCNRLHIAVSDHFESRITIQGTIEIDDISIGKVLAYIDMKRKRNHQSIA
jgi:hypothetical protein